MTDKGKGPALNAFDVSKLRETITNMERELAVARNPHQLSERFPDPDKFDGSQKELYEDFKFAINLKLRANAERIISPQDQAIYIIGRCAGAAHSRFRKYFSGKDKKAITSPDDCWEVLDRFYLDADKETTAQRAIISLQQKNRRFVDYAADFDKFADDTAWNDSALRAALINGLSIEIKEKLIGRNTGAMDCDEVRRLCETLDSDIRAVAMERNALAGKYQNTQGRRGVQNAAPPANLFSGSRATPPTARPPYQAQRGGAAQNTMQNTSGFNQAQRGGPSHTQIHQQASLSRSAPTGTTTIQGGDAMDLSSVGLRGGLDEEEKMRRRVLGLCHYCGSAEHKIAQCPTCPQNLAGRGLELIDSSKNE